jgi:hypothetical protein
MIDLARLTPSTAYLLYVTTLVHVHCTRCAFHEDFEKEFIKTRWSAPSQHATTTTLHQGGSNASSYPLFFLVTLVVAGEQSFL